jgi:hypothetical protein
MAESVDGMFVVKLTGQTGFACWLSAPNSKGFRTMTLREDADIFQTAADAHAAIAKMPRAFSDAGLVFSVEAA